MVREDDTMKLFPGHLMVEVHQAIAITRHTAKYICKGRRHHIELPQAYSDGFVLFRYVLMAGFSQDVAADVKDCF